MGVQFELLVTQVIRTSIMRAIMASFVLFPTVFSKRVKSVTDVFAQKKFSKDIFNSEIFYRYD